MDLNIILMNFVKDGISGSFCWKIPSALECMCCHGYVIYMCRGQIKGSREAIRMVGNFYINQIRDLALISTSDFVWLSMRRIS